MANIENHGGDGDGIAGGALGRSGDEEGSEGSGGIFGAGVDGGSADGGGGGGGVKGEGGGGTGRGNIIGGVTRFSGNDGRTVSGNDDKASIEFDRQA